MQIITFLIAVAALVLAVIALRRTGGLGDLRRQIETLSGRTDSVRDRTADLLGRLEHLVRGKDRPPSGPESGPPGSSTSGGTS